MQRALTGCTSTQSLHTGNLWACGFIACIGSLLHHQVTVPNINWSIFLQDSHWWEGNCFPPSSGKSGLTVFHFSTSSEPFFITNSFSEQSHQKRTQGAALLCPRVRAPWHCTAPKAAKEGEREDAPAPQSSESSGLHRVNAPFFLS